MQGHPTLSQFTNFYVKPEDLANLTHEEIEMMRKLTEPQNQARKFARRSSAGVPGTSYPIPDVLSWF